MFPGGSFGNLCQFPGQIESAGKKGEPFSPDATVPQTPGFDEAHHGVNASGDAKGPEPGIVQAASGFEEALSETVIEIDMQVIEQVFGVVFNAIVDGEQCDKQQNNEYAFERFKDGDCTQTGAAGSIVNGSGWRVNRVSAHY